jgi:hypothetical protein
VPTGGGITVGLNSAIKQSVRARWPLPLKIIAL